MDIMALLWVFHGLLLIGLATMLIDSLGWLAFLTYVVFMPLGALVLWHRAGRHSRDLVRCQLQQGLSILSGGLAAWAVVSGIFSLIIVCGWATAIHSTFAFGTVITGILIPQIMVAASEELTFRGVTQPLFTTRYGPTRGLAITAALFGLFHLPNVIRQEVEPALIPLTLATLALMGVIFGLAYRQAERCLWLPVALHFGWNVASFGVDAVYTYRFTGPQWIVGDTAWFPESGILGGIGLIILGITILRKTHFLKKST